MTGFQGMGLTRRANGERPLSPDLVVVRVMMSVGFGATLAAQRRLEHRQLGVEKAAISRGRSHVAAAFTRRNSGGYSPSHKKSAPGKSAVGIRDSPFGQNADAD